MQWFGSLSLLNLYHQPVAVHILQAVLSSGFQRAVMEQIFVQKFLCSTVQYDVVKGSLFLSHSVKDTMPKHFSSSPSQARV